MDVLFVLPVLIALAAMFIRIWSGKANGVSSGFLWTLFVVHFVLALVYVGYAFATRSDSFEYYNKSQEAEEWMELWGTGTPFIRFLAWPFTHVIGLSFVSTMLIFAMFGFIATGYWYLAIKENLDEMPVVWQTLTWAEIVMILPNIHFWSSSIGKGSVIFLGIALYTYGLSRFNRRLGYMVAGMLLAYFIRPHISLVMAAGTGLGIIMSGRAIPWYAKLGLTLIATAMAGYLLQGTVEFTGVEEGNMDAFLAHRTRELSKATSGVDISNYSLPMKLFTFWFRPLFVDAPGAFGYIVSFENMVYIFMLYVILFKSFKSFASWNGWYKSCLFIFLLASIILAQVSGNLGIAMRQKAQIMPLFFIAFLKAQEYLYRKQSAEGILPGMA